MSEKEYISVSALNKYLKRKYTKDPYLEEVFLVGEISNFRLRPNNHQYFSIKDDNARISAILFKNKVDKLEFELEEGMKVFLTGKLDYYEKTGDVSFIINEIIPSGVGTLYQRYRALGKKLQTEGLFSQPAKPIPLFPKKIAVITSPSGAVIEDIKTTINQRYPFTEIELFPAVVQGEQATESLVKAIATAQKDSDIDVLIIGRGGGSIEDLWPFNEERVVKKLAELEFPVISSVGHETDNTLTDLVADWRVATPTAAAVMATPVTVDDLSQRVIQFDTVLKKLMGDKLGFLQNKINDVRDSYLFQHPQMIYKPFEDSLKTYNDKQINLIQNVVLSSDNALNEVRHKISLLSPADKVNSLESEVVRINDKITNLVGNMVQNNNSLFNEAVGRLDNLSPLQSLQRGYAWPTNQSGENIKTVSELEVGDKVNLKLRDGSLETEIKKIEEKTNDN